MSALPDHASTSKQAYQDQIAVWHPGGQTGSSNLEQLLQMRECKFIGDGFEVLHSLQDLQLFQ
jgi:hypothetical protein